MVRKVGKVNYEIDMPNKGKGRNVFDVNILKNGTHQRLHVYGQLRRRYQNQMRKSPSLHGKVSLALTR